MAKGKKSSSTKKSKKSKNNQREALKEGEWEFVFSNQDKYEGHYSAHVSGLAWRQGAGVYTTHDGQVYESQWKDDKLNEAENVKITFPDKEEYCGIIHKYKYDGPGTYSFPNSSRLTCNFSNNKPVGDVIYIDCYDDLWYGKAEEESALLSREHVFSSELDSERGKGKPKYNVEGNEEEEIAEKTSEEESVDMKELERVIFAKSFQTPSGVDFGESKWIKEFEQYEQRKETILKKLGSRSSGKLTENEKIWYQQYCENMKSLKKVKKPKVHPLLLKQHFDEEAKNTCPPVTVFYARPYEIVEGEGEGEGELYKMLTA